MNQPNFGREPVGPPPPDRRTGRRVKKPDKGVIVNLKTNEWKEFQINPTPVDERISVNYEPIESPGSSHPYFQYVNGNPDDIRFTIYLDDRFENYTGFTYDFIEFLSDFRPQRPYAGGGGSEQFEPPPPMYVSYGDFTRACIVLDMDIERNRFDPHTLVVTRAEIDMHLRTIKE